MWAEVKRIVPWLLILVVSVVWLDPEAAQLKAQLYRLSMVALVIIILHIGRKMLFPYIRLEDSVAKLNESPIAAAIMVFGLFMFMSVILWQSVLR